MLSTSTLVSFGLTALVVELTPGPNMAYLAVLSLDRGRWAGISAVTGIACGLAVLGLVVIFGLGAWLLDSPVFLEGLRWAGSLFLCWLAYESWRDSRAPVETDAARLSLRAYFWRGCLTNLLNPKAGLFLIAVMPEFVTVHPPPPPQLGVLLVVYVAVATAVHASIVGLAGAAKPYLVQRSSRRAAGIVFALLLVGIAVWLFVGTRPARI